MSIKRRLILWPMSAIAGVVLCPVVMGVLQPQMLLQSPLYLVMYGIGALMFLICLLGIIHLFRLEKRYEKTVASKYDSPSGRQVQTKANAQQT